MPEITVIHIAIIAGALIVGLLLGWIMRGNRTAQEKEAISAGWREQLAAQRTEHERLLEQNKSLMDQNSQYQASNKDAKMRASELSTVLKETFERRDELQRQIKDIRNNLENAVNERDQLRNDVNNRTSSQDSAQTLLQQRDVTIEKLNTELRNWQDRLPPLIERYRERNAEAEALQQELTEAHERISALETMVGSDQTRVEPVNRETLADGLDASNDPNDDAMDDSGFDEVLSPQDNDDYEDEDGIYDRAGNGDPVPRDNLKMIKGVGPAIEKTLNEMGICRFNQIAEMSEYDIDRVAHRLKGFRSRIYREDWIGQARELHDQKVSGQN
jgi:predicted flap endonuclease-1-like 5' DNA nuclease